MTPRERMNWIMKYSTWDEAEVVGIDILARCLAFHMYVRHDGDEYFRRIVNEIMTEAYKWAIEHSFELAMARTGSEFKEIANGLDTQDGAAVISMAEKLLKNGEGWNIGG